MFAGPGVAEPDHLHPVALPEDHIVAAVAGDFGSFGAEELRRGRGAAGGEEDEGEKAAHGPTLAGTG